MYCHSTNLVYKCPGVSTILDTPLQQATPVACQTYRATYSQGLSSHHGTIQMNHTLLSLLDMSSVVIYAGHLSVSMHNHEIVYTW